MANGVNKVQPFEHASPVVWAPVAGGTGVPVAESQDARGAVSINIRGGRNYEKLSDEIGPNGEVSATLIWRDLCVKVIDAKEQETVLLHPQTGFLEPGHILAIMGPSGSGKSTLLDTLAGRLSANATKTGGIFVNGHKSNLSYGTVAYVTQDDVLPGTLTTRECIHFAGMLRLPPSMTKRQKDEQIEKTISELGLDRCRDTHIGNWHLRGISGGQRRRVSIACELVMNPKLCFLDEPTSGLDAASSYHLASLLRRLASGGRTLVTTIHQPSSEVFEKMDKLLLLSGGRPIFFGDCTDSAGFVAQAGLPIPEFRSLPDHLLHIVNADFLTEESKAEGSGIDDQINRLSDLYAARIKPELDDRAMAMSKEQGQKFVGNTNLNSALVHFWWLRKRQTLTGMRNVGIFWLRVAMYLMLCICMGTVYFDLGQGFAGGVQARASLLFFTVAFLTFMSIAAFPAFVDDMKIFIRERLNGYYGVGTFAITDTMAASPFIFLIAVISTIGLYFLVGFNLHGDCLVYFAVNLFLALLTVESLMMMIAAIVPHFLMGIAAGSGILGMFMIVCGYFQYTQALPAPVWRYPMHYLAYHTYAFSGLMHNEFEGTDGWQCPGLPDGDFTCTMTGEEVLDFFQIDKREKWVDVAIMAGMCIFYRLGFFLMLKLKENFNHR